MQVGIHNKLRCEQILKETSHFLNGLSDNTRGLNNCSSVDVLVHCCVHICMMSHQNAYVLCHHLNSMTLPHRQCKGLLVNVFQAFIFSAELMDYLIENGSKWMFYIGHVF
jgi:hypothetical protein